VTKSEKHSNVFGFPKSGSNHGRDRHTLKVIVLRIRKLSLNGELIQTYQTKRRDDSCS